MRGGSLLSLALCLALFASSSYQAAQINRIKRQARSNLQTCSISPAVEDPRTPTHENEGITINCAADGHVDVCVIKHTKPMYVGQCTNGNTQTCTNGEQTKCIATANDNGMTCEEDSRIQYIMGNNGCGIKISRADPDDTGKWEFMVSDYSGNTNPSGNSKTVTLYTFNRTIVDFTDDREQAITRNLEVWYNYDENENEYRSGSNGYENIRLNCNGRGGRPEPTITWMINNNDRLAFGEDLSGEADRIFNPKEQFTHTYDPEGYIRDKSSELDFTINQEFMSYIGNNYGIDVNPEGEQFSFELTCIVDQGDYGKEELSMMINVRRVYWRNGFNGWEIFGISIGAILGFAIIVALLIVCCCAAIKGWWCFGNPDRRYEDANNQKRRPRTQ